LCFAPASRIFFKQCTVFFISIWVNPGLAQDFLLHEMFFRLHFPLKIHSPVGETGEATELTEDHWEANKISAFVMAVQRVNAKMYRHILNYIST
jgi:hypothetical protein